MGKIKKAGLILGGTSLGTVIIGWSMAPLIGFIRPEFVPSITYLRILLLGIPVFFFTSLTMWVLITLKKRMILASIYIASMVLNITANIILTPNIGPLAAAWITVASELFILVLSFLFLRPLFYAVKTDQT